jgi:hypothetical protein
VFLADVSHDLVLEQPYAKDNRAEDDYKRYHVNEYTLFCVRDSDPLGRRRACAAP